MVQPHDASAALPAPPIYRERAWLLAGTLATLCGAVAPAWSAATSESTPEAVVPQAAAAAPGAIEAAPASGRTPAALVKRADAKPPLSSEQQRQLMLLLMMNSAGPVRPFGGLGR